MWGYAATIFMMGAGVLLLPFILHKLPSETVGIWNIFQIITSLVALIDFGFQPSFARNISYIFSGASGLQKDGMSGINEGGEIDYSLLRGTIRAMQVFYRRMALWVLLFLATAGTAYVYYIAQKYEGSQTEVIIAWLLLISINCFNLYTFYYDALMSGKGLVKRIQQINIIGQAAYLVLAIALIYCGLGLIAIVASQLLSIIIKRVLVYRTFFTPDLRQHLNAAPETDNRQLIRAIMPNAVKLGVCSLAGFVVYKSSMLIGGAFLPLAVMGSYGVTFQLVDIITRCGTVYYQSYVPKIAQYRLQSNIPELRTIYLRSIGMLLLVFAVCGGGMVLFGNWALQLIGSQTMLLPVGQMTLLLAIHLLERQHTIAWGFILAKNEVPFMVPSLIAAAITLMLTYVFVAPLDWGVWGLILAPGIAQLLYQNWKWPAVTIGELWGKNNTATE